jgi:acetyltransferase-like isoleucine patch superfamily enzyme
MNRPERSQIISKLPLVEQIGNDRTSSLNRYREKAVGGKGYLWLLYYDFALMVCGNLHGGIGYFLRNKLLGLLFRKVGPGLILGRGVSLRHPARITLGRKVAIDDYVLLDAGGAGEDGIVLEDEVIVSRNCVIQGKTGPVWIGARSDIGCNTFIGSASGIRIGRNVLIAGNCYLGGAHYVFDRPDIPIMDQGWVSRGPLCVGDGTWLGAGVTVLDGVRIGPGCVVGAGAVVTRDLPEGVVAGGIPAKPIKLRG